MSGYRETSAVGRIIGVMLIDEGIILIIHIGLLWCYYGDYVSFLNTWNTNHLLINFFLVRLLIKILYFTTLMSIFNGQTIGLWVIRGRLQKHNFERINVLTVLGWYLPGSLGRRVPVFGLLISIFNTLMIFFNKRRKAIGDYLVGTSIVVNPPKNNIIRFIKQEPFCIENTNNKEIISLKCFTALDLWERTIGLFSFKKEEDVALLLFPCRRIHTFFMKKNIDIIFLDSEGMVLNIFLNVKKNRFFAGDKNVSMILELPSRKNNISKGDYLSIRY